MIIAPPLRSRARSISLGLISDCNAIAALHHPEQELELGGVAYLRLVVAVDVRRRLAPLVAAKLDIA
jgi:hypothetical protein